MFVSPKQMKLAEEVSFLGEKSQALMEIAGKGIARCIGQFFPTPGVVVLFCGKGHNGGDGLVAARHLLDQGWKILIRLAAPESEMAQLTRENLRSLQQYELINQVPETYGEQLLIIDGLLGIGSLGAPRGEVAELILEMNRLRSQRGGYTVAMDIPSGLDATSGGHEGVCVQADLTVTVGAVKSGLLADTATAMVGRLALAPLPGLTFSEGDPALISTAEALVSLLPTRDFDSHKGTYGRIGILAGSPGFLGAATLCSSAAVHSGGGLVTLYATPDSHDLLAATCIPEVMVQRVKSYRDVLEEKNDILALGPGLGSAHDADLREIVLRATIPCVLDADALNALSPDPSILLQCAGPRLLTPHPGEMERLFPAEGRTRRKWAEDFIELYPVTLLLKGARTIIAQRGADISFNSTGNPGMGSGGMGDVLTGVCAALIGGGHSVRDSAILGAWLCGRSAEIVIFNRSDSQESLSATSVIDHLGPAFHSLRNGDY